METYFKVHTIQEIGDLIKAARKIAGFSQGHFALLSGLSRTSIQRLEQGKKNISLAAFLKVMEILDVTLKLNLSFSFSQPPLFKE